MNAVALLQGEWVREGVEVPRLVRYLAHGSATVFHNAYGSWTWSVEVKGHLNEGIVPLDYMSRASGVEPTQQRAKSIAMVVYLTLTHQAST